MPLTPILTAHWDEADCHTIGGYTRHHGYEALKKALKSDPDSIIQLVKGTSIMMTSASAAAHSVRR